MRKKRVQKDKEYGKKCTEWNQEWKRDLVNGISFFILGSHYSLIKHVLHAMQCSAMQGAMSNVHCKCNMHQIYNTEYTLYSFAYS